MNRFGMNANHAVTIAFGLCFTLAIGLIARGQELSGGSGSTAPGGSNLDVQCNISGAFGACETGQFTDNLGTQTLTYRSSTWDASGNIILKSSGSIRAGSIFNIASNQYNSGSNVAFEAPSGGAFGWSSSTTNIQLAVDTAIARNAAGIIEINSGTAGTFREAKLRSLVIGGTAPALTGTCTTGSQTGGATAGTFTATCTAQTVIITFAFTAPTGWSCNAHDLSTPADALNQTASSTTTATLTGTTVAADVISYNCMAY